MFPIFKQTSYTLLIIFPYIVLLFTFDIAFKPFTI